MTYIRTNVAKPANSAGAGSPKKPNVTIIAVADIATYPARDDKGVLIAGNFVLNTGAQAISLYMTPSKIKAGYEPEGDEDGQTFKHKFEGPHPGDSLAINEYVQNNSGEPCIIIVENCADASKRVYGTKCAPMHLKPSGTDENENRNHMLVFEQYAKRNLVPAHYTGAIPTVAPFTVVSSTALALSPANGYVYQLPSLAVTASIAIATNTLEHGDIVTLIGGGGVAPATLTSGVVNMSALLVASAAWTGLAGAVINLKVFKAGSVTLFIEQSRG
jgi:hypothetical protein